MDSDAQTWPRVAGVSHRPAPEDDFQGGPEATFPTMDHPGVEMSKPLDRQYQAAVDVVVADAIRRPEAKSQLDSDVSQLFLREPMRVRT
jgi:hypothetical protein